MCAWRMRWTSLAVLGLASLRDSKLAYWVGESAKFPNTKVDRITPVTAERP